MGRVSTNVLCTIVCAITSLVFICLVPMLEGEDLRFAEAMVVSMTVGALLFNREARREERSEE